MGVRAAGVVRSLPTIPRVGGVVGGQGTLPPDRADAAGQTLDASLAALGVVLEGYSPVTSTDLADPVLVEIADAHGVSTAQVVLPWHLDHVVVVIPESVTPARITANADVLGFALTGAERDRVDGLARG